MADSGNDRYSLPLVVTVWGVISGVVVLLLLASWLIDRSVKRRGSRVTNSADIWYEVRESRRDADIPIYQHGRDISWSSWSRRNKRRG